MAKAPHSVTAHAALSTQLIHHPYVAPSEFDSAAVGVHKASTVIFPNVAAMRSRTWTDKSAYTYGLHGTPTTFTLEERLATAEGGQHCILVPSGLAAIALVDLALLQAGDHVLIPDNAYGPGKDFASAELDKWDVQCEYYDAQHPGDLAARITPKTRLVWLEAPGSVTLEFPDVPALVAAVASANDARQAQGLGRRIVTALDNTWGAGVAFQPFDLGVDVSMQALTKYPSGGADVLMGSVITRDADLHHAMLMTHMRLGLSVAANDAELVLRGLPSMALRYAHQDASTRALAQWASTRDEFEVVFHPALATSPGHATWKRDCTGAACLFTVAFAARYTAAQVDAFCDALQLFQLGYSWAGPMSLIVPYDMAGMREGQWPHSGAVVRFAVGLEDTADLQADIEQALAKLG
ncbi:MAG: cystathionine beta-lyase [Burkholderiaceae bacterium]|nr:cystathionine beta-lyase [Burkholderiaceae bacterium]